MNTFKCLVLHNLWIHSKIHTCSCTVYKQIFCIPLVAHHSTVYVCVCVCFTSTYYVCAPYSSQVNLQRFHIRSSDCYLFNAFCFVFLPPRLHILYIYYHSMRNSSFCTHFRLTMPLFVVKSTSGNKCSCRRSASQETINSSYMESTFIFLVHHSILFRRMDEWIARHLYGICMSVCGELNLRKVLEKSQRRKEGRKCWLNACSMHNVLNVSSRNSDFLFPVAFVLSIRRRDTHS